MSFWTRDPDPQQRRRFVQQPEPAAPDVSAGLVSLPVALGSPSLNQEISPALLTLTTTVRSPSLDQSVGLPLISLTATLASPQLNLSVAPAVITLAVTIPALAVAPDQTVSAGLVSLTATIRSPSVDQSVALPVIGLATGLAPPSIEQSVAPNRHVDDLFLWVHVVSGAAAPQTVDIGLISLPTTLASPRVDQTVAPSLVSLPTTLASPSVTQTVAPSLITAALTLRSPSLDQVVAPSLVSLTTTVRSPSVAPTVSPGLISLPIRLAADYATTILATSGLVGYWRIGEASGSVLDSSGNGTTGSASGSGITRDVTGALASGDDGAITNDGTGFIQFASPSSALDVGDVFTLEAWVKPAATGTALGIVSKGPFRWLLRLDASGNLELVRSGVASIVTSTSAVGTGAWHHVVATKNGSTNVLYIDGVDVTGSVSNQTMDADAGAQMFIGADYVAGPFHTDPFDGSIDEVAVYGVALSAATVAAHAAGIGAGPRVDQSVTASLVSQTVTPRALAITQEGGPQTVATDVAALPTTLHLASVNQQVGPFVEVAIGWPMVVTLRSPTLTQSAAPNAVALATTLHAPSITQSVALPVVSLTTTLHSPTISTTAPPQTVRPIRLPFSIDLGTYSFGYNLPFESEVSIALCDDFDGEKYVNRHTAPASGIVDAIHARLWVEDSGFLGQTAVARAVIYAVSGSNPGALLAQGDEVVVPNRGDDNGITSESAESDQYIRLPFPSGVAVVAGTDYFIGIITKAPGGGPGNCLRLAYTDSGGTLRYATDVYADGASDPFGTPGSGTAKLHLYASMGPALAPDLAVSVNRISLPTTVPTLVITQPAAQTVSPNLLSLTTTVRSLVVSALLQPALISQTLTVRSPGIHQTIAAGRISLATTIPSASIGQTVAPALLTRTLTIRSSIIAGTQTVSPSAIALTLTPRGPFIARAGAAPPGWTGAVEYVVEFFDSDLSFGPGTKIGELWEARNIGWSRYDRLPGKAFMTLYQDSPHLRLFNPLTTHVKITRVHPLGDMQVYAGQFIDYDSTGDDVVLSFFDYLSLFAISRSGYKTMYPRKKLGTEIAQVEVAAAIAKSYSPLGFIAMGTIQNPVGEDGTTEIITNEQFGTMDQLRLQLLWDLAEMGRVNTANHVTFEITRTAPYTFNFWKNRGTNQNIGLILNGSVDDYQYLPNWTRYRNDIATLGTTVGGGATEIVSTNEIAAGVRGRRQDVATIKTLLGITSSTVELDQQKAATASMLTALSQRTPALQVNLMRGALAPYDGWEICDTVVVEIDNGVDILTTRKRIVGARGLYTEAGEDLGLILEPIPS